MVVDLLFRVACHGGGDEALRTHLKRVTDSAYTRKSLGGVDIEGDYLAPIIAESHDEDCRREIMRHLRECLSATGSKHWQKIYGGLALAENLMQHGSSSLLAEVAQGFHFDLVQKVSLLENYDAKARACTDRKAQNLVRTKASEFRSMLVSLLEKENKEQDHDDLDTASTCDSGSISTPCSTRSPSNVSSSSLDIDLHFDDAFAELSEWVESADSDTPSVVPSPRAPWEELVC